MANIFLDTNFYFQLLKGELNANIHDSNQVYVSTLSVHIACYSLKIKVPNLHLTNSLATINTLDFSANILTKACVGPTTDLEDNIQLHSASLADCDYFLTFDDQLLKMKFFGKTQITTTINPNL